ncbi:hypothetical protein NQ317_000435 [Molorchus minor]|uniref:DDE Tnp4 domain-containing protein n=1 Tax=Molorchus minor TaxID=1323400 RepID=A0ABQ9IVG2_9CUCU|nr:hypothetical protein NQ317_000435 [Molorchus minor]
MSSSSSPEILRNRLLWEDSSESDNSSDYENRPIRAPRNFRMRFDHFTRWSDEEFRVRFRLTKETVRVLEQRFQDDIAPKTARNHAITAMQQILIVLRFCATGCMLQTVGDFAGIHKATATPEYINMPRTPEEIERNKRNFYRIAKFPRVIGAIDCTHIKIISPGGANAENFRNRKGYFSLNVQVVGDANLYIRDIVARWPGSTHDQTIFNNSLLKARFENNEFVNVEHVFNESQIRSRNPIERLFGVLKRRFPILSLGIRLSLDSAKLVIIACAVLHNIALSLNEPDPIDDPFVTADYGSNENAAGIDGPRENPRENNNLRHEFLLYFMNLLEENEA